MSRSKILLILAIFSVFFVIGELFFVPKTYVNSAIVRALQAPRVFLDALRSSHELVTQLKSAQLENQSLRAQFLEAQNQPGIIKEGATAYLRVPVYSSYPLNNVATVTLAAGEQEGVRAGAVVMVAPGVFLGEVVKTYAHQSEVRTLYDPGWELPVKIGSDKVDALLIGGHEPLLTLISKRKPVGADQAVILAAKQYPYGLLLGATGAVVDSAKDPFQEAPLLLSYQAGDLGQVLVVLTAP